MPDRETPLYDEPLGSLIRGAAERARGSFRTLAPGLAGKLVPWLQSLTRSGRLEDYFMHPRRFPMLLLPWWAAGDQAEREAAFFGDVVYSTMNGYWLVRLIDDFVDRREGVAAELLPAVAVLHTEFQSPYLRHFPADAPFWGRFRELWGRAADLTLPDPSSDGQALFRRAGDTIGAALIPIGAVLERAGRLDRLPLWNETTRGLAEVEQLLDDLTDWLADSAQSQPNILLAEGSRRARAGEGAAGWILREGYHWGLDEADRRLEVLRSPASALAGSGLLRFLDGRRRMVDAMRADVLPGLDQLMNLRSAFDGTPA